MPPTGRDSQPAEAANAGLDSTSTCAARNGPNAAAPRASGHLMPGAGTVPECNSTASMAAPAPTSARHAAHAPIPDCHTGSHVPNPSRSAVSTASPATPAVANPTPDSPRAASYSATMAITATATLVQASHRCGGDACATSRTASRPPTPRPTSAPGPASVRTSGATSPATQLSSTAAAATPAPESAAKPPQAGGAQ